MGLFAVYYVNTVDGSFGVTHEPDWRLVLNIFGASS